MAFVLDANPSSPTMNSYVTRAEADDYFAGNFTAMTAWSALEDAQKDAALRQASLKLDTLNYSGLKTSSTQPMAMPRTGVIDREGNTYPSNVVIPKVKYAACEMAYWIISEEDRYFSDQDMQQVDSFKVGPLTAKKDTGATLELPLSVQDLLDSVGPGFGTDPSIKNPTFARM